MSLRIRIIGLVGIVGFLGFAPGIQAQQRVQPTGTPTWAPRKIVATPTPAPPLTPVEAEAKALGEKLSAIDVVVWTTVRKQWSDSEACLKAVDAHLEASTETVKALIRDSEVINCTLEEGSKRRKIRLTSDDARKTFLLGYHDAIESLRALRTSFESRPEAQEVLDEVRSRQRKWQRGICEALEPVKPPVIVPKPKPLPNNLPVESS